MRESMTGMSENIMEVFRKKLNAFKAAGLVGRCALSARFLTGLWAFLMLTVFPLYTKNHYSQMGLRKFCFFLWTSIICLVPAGVCLVLSLGCGGRKKIQVFAERFSDLDRAMFFYLAVAVLSWYMSVDRSQAWTGVDGWFMGLRTQLLLVLLYYLVSRYFPWKKVIFVGHFLASGLVFLLGIGHRFGIDPLGMYEGIDESYQLLFLSTIGQASWYSSYVCTVLVIGITGFFVEKKPAVRIGLGVYCMLGFSTVVTQNSDSAFVAVAFLLFGLYLSACDSLDGMERFFETVLLMLGSFKLMGSLQMIFQDRATALGGLSEFLSKSTETWLLFLTVCIVYMLFLFYRQKNPDKQELVGGRLWRRSAVIAVSAVLLFYAAVVWMNTTGRLKAWFGIQSTNLYLLFDQSWGNSRGFTWKLTLGAFGSFPFFRKLFGVGPDCFAAYCYGDPELAAALNRYFGWDQTLTNAHNEFLNTMFCMGLTGLIAFGMIFIVAFWRFYQGRKKNPYALLGMLAVLSYGAHNFFCYQQVCCTPFLFLLLGMSENLISKKRALISDDGE